MDKILKLEINKVFKELDYIKSEYDYKNELILSLDNEFMEAVNGYLNENPNLRKKFDEKEDKLQKDRIEKIKASDLTEEVSEDESEEYEDGEDVEDGGETKKKNPRLKKLYREIVKLTHPDRVKNFKLNNLYIEATDFYDNDDIFGIYMICTELDIDYDIKEEEIELMQTEIHKVRKQIKFIQSTFTWKWSQVKNDKQRNDLIVQFIGQRLNT